MCLLLQAQDDLDAARPYCEQAYALALEYGNDNIAREAAEKYNSMMEETYSN